MSATASTPSLLLLAGPTAAGKTALSLDLAAALDVGIEIVSADSRQVYRGLDIGTAKASLAERARVPHHLIDVIDPDQTYDVARFVEEARAAVALIVAAGRLPVVVGGTGLYLRALCGGLAPAVGRDQALRDELEAFRVRHGNAALHARLQAIDSEAAARIPINDVVRVVRALEVHTATGETLSARQRAHAFADRPYRVRWLVVDQSAAILEERIRQRTQAMFDRGLVDEAVALRARFGEVAVLRTLGYAEALAVADGRLDRGAAIEQTHLRTRRFAKRQRTWLRREPVDDWLLAPDVAALRAALARLGDAHP